MESSNEGRRGLLARQVAWNLFLLAVGSALCAAAINGILLPHRFLSGGFTGLALMVHYAVPSLSVSVLYLLLNIPVFALGWVYVGKRFFFYSLAGMVLYSAAVAVVKVSLPVEDTMLAALLAGILMGAGSGVVFRSLGSAGGTDILSVILLQGFSIRLGTTLLAFNVVVLVAGAALFSLDMALYTLIFIYVSSHVVNLVVSGLSQRKAVTIISQHWEAISREILHEIRRGVTILHGEGGYSREPERVLYTVVTFRELSRLKRLVRGQDPQAFLVVNDTLEVMGQRIGNQPRW